MRASRTERRRRVYDPRKFHHPPFGEIARDIVGARIFGGIHFRFDQEAGARQGPRC